MDIALRKLDGDYYVSQADHISPQLGGDLSNSPFWSMSKTDGECSIVSDLAAHPSFKRVEGPWTVFGVVGQLDFSLTGILSRVSAIVADRNISIFAISTFDTDYFLVHKEAADAAADAWLEKGLILQDSE